MSDITISNNKQLNKFLKDEEYRDYFLKYENE